MDGLRDGLRRVLYITYFFPPAGGGGTRRPTKIARYLSDAGWRPLVLTVPPDEYPLLDESYPEEHTLANVTRIRPVQRLPWRDPGIRWSIPLLRAARAAIRRERPEAVLYSGAPFRAAIVLPLLGLPYVVDLRDPWAWDETYRLSGWRARRAAVVDATLERAALGRAGAITTVSAPIADRYRSAYPGTPVHAVLGGFDPAEFSAPVEPPARFTLTYTGTFSESFGHTARLLLESVAAFRTRRPDAKLAVELVGDALASDVALARSLGLEGVVTFHGRRPHSEAVDALRRSSLLWLQPGITDPWVMTGKVFEYLASGRPMLAVGSGQAMHDVALRSGLVTLVPREPAAVAEALARHYDRRHEPVAVDCDYVGRFAYPAVAARFAEILGETVARQRSAVT